MTDEIKVQSKNEKTKLIVVIAAVLITVLTIVAIVLVSSGGATAKKVKEQLSLGDKYLSELQYEQAIAAYELAIEIDPKCEEAYLGLAEIYMATGEYEKAEEILEKAEEALGETESIREKKKKIEEKKNKATGNEGKKPGGGSQAGDGSIGTEGSEPTATKAPTSTPKPTPTPAPTPVPYKDLASIKEISKAKAGDVVTFGSYEQDGAVSNGAEPLEWYVLDRQGDRLLLLSKYLLEEVDCHENPHETVTWETCSLRKWLNDRFYHGTFTNSEKYYIDLSNLETADNEIFGTDGGNATQDRVFLLSWEEAKQYFSYTSRTWSNDSWSHDYIAITFQDSRANGTMTEYCLYQDDYPGRWWMRSPGENAGDFMWVRGGTDYEGTYASNGEGYIRPAIWLNLGAVPEDTVILSKDPVVPGTQKELATAEVGDFVTFGSYEQDNNTGNGAEDIQWHVLDKQGDKVLLLSEKVLDGKQFHKESYYMDGGGMRPVTWENCSLREWLNNDFFKAAFTGEEQQRILLSALSSPEEYGDVSEGVTEDKVFLLSYDDIPRYFSVTEEGRSWWNDNPTCWWKPLNDGRLATKATAYAAANGVSSFSKKQGNADDGNGNWWLRSTSAVVGVTGEVRRSYTNVDMDFVGVRPAIWVQVTP